ncbi:hypothetical protein EZV62_024741 [Acer yangbiense]|uniref:CCHC-type domain-containing protein n=1 Tax=Acer yangbiense TaxID=1000413 RepID=A0A5C7GXS2_9ROSI|nr:hypothetical protein EZV62_024741 [Acer yangbiense]
MNADELALLCSALSVKEKERPVRTLDSNLIDIGARKLSLTLVGKVLATKLVNRTAFIDVMTSVWRVSEGVDIEWAEGNIFVLNFKNLEDRKRILSGGPWNTVIVFEKPTGEGDILNMSFSKVEFWIQIHNLPLICMTEDIVIDAKEPLIRCLRVDLLGTGKITTMLLRYERLLDFCFKCGRLGHSIRDCKEDGDTSKVTSEANGMHSSAEGGSFGDRWRQKCQNPIQRKTEGCIDPSNHCLGTDKSINEIKDLVGPGVKSFGGSMSNDEERQKALDKKNENKCKSDSCAIGIPTGLDHSREMKISVHLSIPVGLAHDELSSELLTAPKPMKLVGENVCNIGSSQVSGIDSGSSNKIHKPVKWKRIARERKITECVMERGGVLIRDDVASLRKRDGGVLEEEGNYDQKKKKENMLQVGTASTKEELVATVSPTNSVAMGNGNLPNEIRRKDKGISGMEELKV